MADSPLGNFPEIANAYASSFTQARNKRAASGEEYNTGVAVDNEKIAAQAEVQRLQSLIDPKAYRKVKKEDGGFDFFDPEGNQVDIATLASRTGTKAADWIDDSENPVDIQYRNDYTNLQEFINALASKDQDTIDQFKKADPNLGRYTADKGGMDKLLQEFRKSYERYYVPRSADPQAWGRAPSRVVVPTRKTGETDYLGSSAGGI